jgi:hypothetical protein
MTVSSIDKSGQVVSKERVSDLGEDVFIPQPLREYPLTHFLRLADDPE